MPNPCYSYPADMPPDGTNKGPARAARRGLREMPYSCYSYPIMCVSYPEDPPAARSDVAAVRLTCAECPLPPASATDRVPRPSGGPACSCQEVPCAYDVLRISG